MMSAEELRYKRSPKFLSADVGAGDMALFNPEKAEDYYGLGDTGREIWLLLEEPRTRRELLDALRQRYDGSPLEIATDLDTFLQELIDEEIVEIDH